jgi:phage terminase small subunit
MHDHPPTSLTATALTKPEGLTHKQEAFAQHLAVYGQPVEAYLATYAVKKTRNRNALRASAFNIANHPKVRARVAVLQAASAERAVTTNAELMAALEELVDVDPAEIVAVVVSPCRFCHGINHEYQWATPDEHALACAKSIHRGEPAPNDVGGFGFTLDREPHGECPQCHGAGDARVHFSNTAAASRGARRLVRGVELFPDGRLKRLHLHDQAALRVELHKLRGMVVDRSLNVNVNTSAPDLRNMSREEQLDLLESIKPTRTAPVAAVTIKGELA